MSPKTRATPRSACPSSVRIDLIPSPRAAALAYAWLALVCGVMMTAALPLGVRGAACIVVATLYAGAVRRFIGLKGRNAVRALCLRRDGVLVVRLGAQTSLHPATLAPGSFRLGSSVLVLRLRTAAGLRSVLVDGAIHQAATFRALCRRLEWQMGGGPGRRRTPTDTIRD
jgi:hypothetical protein